MSEMQPDNNKEKVVLNHVNASKVFDKYAPPVYGKILSIVHQEMIANKLLEKVFITALTDKNQPSHTLNSPLVSLLNQSREKSYKTIRALNIFTECCAGTSVHIT